jgi:ATP adenylyltransferase
MRLIESSKPNNKADLVSHERLWAPWRLAYVATAKDDQLREDACFLCRYRDDQRDAENFVVSRGKHTLSVLNRFPYNNGHVLVAPLAHKATVDEMNDDELLACMHEVRRLAGVYARILQPDGFNIGLNLGRAAGAGLPGHLHWHLVPRWNGDTNFMTVVDDVRVISQSLQSLYNLVTATLEAPR